MDIIPPLEAQNHSCRELRICHHRSVCISPSQSIPQDLRKAHHIPTFMELVKHTTLAKSGRVPGLKNYRCTLSMEGDLGVADTSGSTVLAILNIQVNWAVIAVLRSELDAVATKATIIGQHLTEKLE